MDVIIKLLETGKIGSTIAKEAQKKKENTSFFQAETTSSSSEDEGVRASDTFCALSLQKV